MALWQRVVPVALTAFLNLPFSAQCGFAIVPAADKEWHRNEGWTIPGLTDAKGFAKIHRNISGKSEDWVWPEGISVVWVVHDRDYDVQFPDAVFDENRSRKRMLPRRFKLYAMLRWEMNGTPYAYSLSLALTMSAALLRSHYQSRRADKRMR